VLVGNVISAASLATGLSACATWLHAQLLAAFLEGIHTFGSPSGQIDVHRGSHACSQVGGAGVQISKLGAQLESFVGLGFDTVTNRFDSEGKTIENFTDVSSFLHGDDSELILLIDPGQEGLGGIVENATTLGPVALHTSGNQVLVPRDKQEVVVNELLSDLLLHASQRVVVARKVSREAGESLLHQALHLDTLILRDTR